MLRRLPWFCHPRRESVGEAQAQLGRTQQSQATLERAYREAQIDSDARVEAGAGRIAAEKWGSRLHALEGRLGR